MKTIKRYSFWRTFWVVLAIYIFFGLLGIIFASIAPTEASKGFDWHKIMTWRHVLSQCAGILFSVFFYYYSLNGFYRLIVTRQNSFQFIKYAVLAVLTLGLYLFLSYTFLTPAAEKQRKEFTTGLILFSFSLSTLFQVGLSLVIAYLTNLRDERKQRKVLEEQKMQLEVEKSQANLNFLKAQINPHFLHNTLNFLYAKSLPYSPELSEGILTLSDIMRYALSEGNAKDGKAPLKDEIEHVRNVIKINQLRFSNNLNVNFEVNGVVNGAVIIPFVLITLVENAFKHGDLKSTQDPIDIRLQVKNEELYFYCRNKNKMGTKEISTGVGLDNIKKRLDLAYGSMYALKVKDEGGSYTTELTIKKL
jgi:two-component system LytT family sensor kinase